MWCVSVPIKIETTKTASNTPSTRVIKGDSDPITDDALVPTLDVKFSGNVNINIKNSFFVGALTTPKKNYLLTKVKMKMILRIPKKASTTPKINAISGKSCCTADDVADTMELTISLDKFIILTN